jgi:mRNA-degrading endonuclease RelE of RelBE toxin-antitoxin system
MSYVFVSSTAVKTDIVAATNYYKVIHPKLARQFLLRIREAKEYIANSPFGFQIKYKKVRTIFLKQFPYQIHYMIDETNRVIVILAVIHAYKNPVDYSNR